MSRDSDYARAEERIRKELDMDKLDKAANAMQVKQLLLDYFRAPNQKWPAAKSNKFVNEMTKRISEWHDIPTAGYTKPLKIKKPLPYFKTVANRKNIEYEVREDDRVRFRKIDGSMSRWHTAKRANFYIKRRRVVKK